MLAKPLPAGRWPDERIYRKPCQQSDVLGLRVLFAVLRPGGEEGTVYIYHRAQQFANRKVYFLLSINISRYRNSGGI